MGSSTTETLEFEMAKKSANATTAAQKLKNGAKKLLGTAKKSGKLAAALPFAALMVEEVRAAQIETMPSFDLAGLDPFTQPEQPQELVMEEVAPEGLAKAADEEVQGLLAELVGESRSGDLLLAQAETVNERAAGYIASDAGSSAAASSATATAAGTAEAAAAGFELSGLPAVAAAAGPAGVLVAAAATVAVAANNNNGVAAPEARNDVDNGDGTHLSTSLSDLQSGGVDAVNATGDVLHLNVGNVSSLSPTTAFPLFGDANKDGILSADENAALDVYLDVASAQQLADLNQVLGVSGLKSLAAAGVDHIQINVANDTALKAMLADSQFGTRMETLNANGMTGNVVNLAANQSATLSLQDVDAMLANGMHFAADDQVTLHATSAEATHLTSSLKDLQAMGVDAVTTAAGVDNVHINLGGFDAAGTATNAAVVFNPAGLPTFASEDNVTLDVANVGQLHSIAASGAALHAANIDHVQLNLNDQAAFAASFSSNSIFQVADTLALKNAQVDTLINVGTDVTISAQQAGVLVDGQVHFSDAHDVTLGLNNTDATHLHTSLKDLQGLGVDMVNTAGASGDVHLNFGADGALSTTTHIPQFSAEHEVTVDLANLSQLHTAAGSAAAFAAAGIDHVQMNFKDQAAFNQVIASGNTFDTDMQTLADQHITVNQLVDMASDNVALTQTQAHILSDGGIHFAANDHVSLNAEGTHVGNLSDLHKVGVDAVHGTATLTHLDVNVGDAAELAKPGSLPVFDSALDVSLNIHSQADYNALSHISLSDLHIDNLNIDFAANINQLLVADIDKISHDGALVTDATYQDLLDVLTQSGLSSVELANVPAQTQPALTISDDLAAALHGANMLDAVPSSFINLRAEASTADHAYAVLDTSLKAMAELGVDRVQTEGSVEKVYVSLGGSVGDIASIIEGFTAGTDVGANGLFGDKDAGLVVEQATFGSLSNAQINDLAVKLAHLGFTEVDVLDSTGGPKAFHIDTTQSTPVFQQGVTLATHDVEVIDDAFGSDVLDKKAV